jgi:tight adherence protein B
MKWTDLSAWLNGGSLQPLNLSKIGCLVSLGIAVTCATWDALGNLGSPFNRYHSRYVARMDVKLRSMFIKAPAQRLVLGQLLVILVIGMMELIVGIPYWWLVMAAAVLSLEGYLWMKHRERTRILERQVEPFVLALAYALKTTPSIGQALAIVHRRLRPPLQDEIGLVLKELRVGSTIDQALLNMSSRVRVIEFDAALTSTLVGRQVGGNLPDILATSAATLRETSRLAQTLKSKTASGRVQLIVLAVAPLVVVLGFSAASPGYFAILNDSVLGFGLELLAGGLWVFALVLGHGLLAVNE